MEEKEIEVVETEEEKAEDLSDGSNVEISVPEVTEEEKTEDDSSPIDEIKPTEEAMKTAEELTGLTEEELLDPQKMALSEALIDMGVKISDEDSKIFSDIVIRYRLKEKNLNPYHEFPESIKEIIRHMAMKAGAGANRYKQISELFLDEFIAQSNIDQALNKFERELSAIYDMPSFTDIQLETVKEAFTKNIFAKIDEIKEKDPEKAEMLHEVSDSFMRTAENDLQKEIYDTKTGCKRYVRRNCNDDQFKKELSEISFRADKSIFEHIDPEEYYKAVKKLITEPISLYDTEVDIDNIKVVDDPEGLTRIDNETHKVYSIDPDTKEETEVVDLSEFYEDEEENAEVDEDVKKETPDIKIDRKKVNEYLSQYMNETFTDEDAKKYILLMVKVFEELDPSDTADATYIHYSMRNTITASESEQVKTEFASQILNSIKDTIMHIRSEEEKFYADESRKQRRKETN